MAFRKWLLMDGSNLSKLEPKMYRNTDECAMLVRQLIKIIISCATADGLQIKQPICVSYLSFFRFLNKETVTPLNCTLTIWVFNKFYGIRSSV